MDQDDRAILDAYFKTVRHSNGWQQHSVRGFFAGVVQKKLRLKLDSKKIDGNRIYRIVDAGSTRSNSPRPSRQSA